MPVPGEDYLLRLRWTDPKALTSNILDLVTASNDEPVALVAWEARDSGEFVQGGFSVIRFSKTGQILWQSTHTLCGPAAGDDCGQWLLQHGAITFDGDRFIVAGTIANPSKGNMIESIAIGIDDGGAVAWCHRYQTTFSIGRAMGIAPLAKPGRFLIASRNFNETESWLYGIDRNGALTGLEMRFFKKFLQRLRALPKQGIFVLGTNNDDPSHPLGSILNIDPTTAKPAWERTYDPGDGTTLRWCDAAVGKDLTVIGNGATAGTPLVATLAGTGAPDAGNVRSSFRPQAGDANLRLNGIANFPTPASTSSICGEFNDAAWHLAIDDAVNILWQKKYNHGPSSATLTPILFPNANAVIAGGLANVPADPPRALLVQSQVAIGGPAKFACGEETKAAFEPVDIPSETIKSPFKELAMRSSNWFVNQAPLIEVEVGCLP